MAISNINVEQVSGAKIIIDTDLAGAVVAVKSGSTTVYLLELDNTANAAASFVKLWNVAAGSVTLGTTDPDLVIRVPASTKVEIAIPDGLVFATALSMAAVTTGGTGGTTNPTSDVVAKIVYV